MTKREKIWLRDGRKCTCCGARLHIDKTKYNDNFYCQLDHIVPKSLGGSNDEGNLRATCRACNSKRQNKSSKKLLLMYENRIRQSNIINDLEHFKFDVENNIIQYDNLLELKNQITKVYEENINTINHLLKAIKKGDVK